MTINTNDPTEKAIAACKDLAAKLGITVETNEYHITLTVNGVSIEFWIGEVGKVNEVLSFIAASHNKAVPAQAKAPAKAAAPAPAAEPAPAEPTAEPTAEPAPAKADD